jgi:hypothetical protein
VDEYGKWRNGDIFYNCAYEKPFCDYSEFIPIEDLPDIINKAIAEDIPPCEWDDSVEWPKLTGKETKAELVSMVEDLHAAEIYTFDSWFNKSDYDTYSHRFNTPGGEQLIAFGDYGYG